MGINVSLHSNLDPVAPLLGAPSTTAIAITAPTIAAPAAPTIAAGVPVPRPNLPETRVVATAM